MDVQHLAFVRQRVQAERVEPVQQRVEAGVPGSGPGLKPGEGALVRHVRRSDAAVPSARQQDAGDDRGDHCNGRDRYEQPESAALGEAARPFRVGAPLRGLDLRGGAGVRVFLATGGRCYRRLTRARQADSLVESDPEGRKVFRIWRFLWPLRETPIGANPQGG